MNISLLTKLATKIKILFDDSLILENNSETKALCDKLKLFNEERKCTTVVYINLIRFRLSLHLKLLFSQTQMAFTFKLCVSWPPTGCKQGPSVSELSRRYYRWLQWWPILTKLHSLLKIGIIYRLARSDTLRECSSLVMKIYNLLLHYNVCLYIYQLYKFMSSSCQVVTS